MGRRERPGWHALGSHGDFPKVHVLGIDCPNGSGLQLAVSDDKWLIAKGRHEGDRIACVVAIA